MDSSPAEASNPQKLEEMEGSSVTGSTFGDLFDAIARSSYPSLIILLCLPFIQPISLGPLGTAGGLTLAALGWQLAMGRDTPWIPRKLREMPVSAANWLRIERGNAKLLTLCARITKPRFSMLFSARRGEATVGLLVCIAGLLMAIPFIGVPLNNTFPALMAVCAALALLERDGLMILFSLFWMVVSVLYFALVIWAIFVVGTEAALPFLEQLLSS